MSEIRHSRGQRKGEDRTLDQNEARDLNRREFTQAKVYTVSPRTFTSGPVAVEAWAITKIDPSSGAIVATLPAIRSEYLQLVIHNPGSSTNAIVATPVTGQTVRSAATLSMSTAFQSLTLATDLVDKNWIPI
jgi:hypothetical protein